MSERPKLGKLKSAYFFIKRITDISGAVIGLVVFSPLFLILPLIIKIDSKGPVFYRRKVIGKNGKPFSAFKFRTMVLNAEQILQEDQDLNAKFLLRFKLKNDPRITRLGYFLRKYSLDEVPQLFNVLSGQMSLVGPRIMTEIELKEYGKRRNKVLAIKPGLSGLWQVSGRQEVPFERRRALDIFYVDNPSLTKDMIIIFKTIRVMLRAKGAY